MSPRGGLLRCWAASFLASAATNTTNFRRHQGVRKRGKTWRGGEASRVNEALGRKLTKGEWGKIDGARPSAFGHSRRISEALLPNVNGDSVCEAHVQGVGGGAVANEPL